MRFSYTLDEVPTRRLVQNGQEFTALYAYGSAEIEVDRDNQWWVVTIYLDAYSRHGGLTEIELPKSDPLWGAIANELEAHYGRHILDSFHDYAMEMRA